jgi:hypothetical protein
LLGAASVAVSEDAQKPPHRHCERSEDSMGSG